jgi:hypothetical protein
MMAAHSNIVFGRVFSLYTMYILMIGLLMQLLICIQTIRDKLLYGVVIVALVRFTDLFIYMLRQTVTL